MKVTIDINKQLLNEIEKEAELCLIKTADAVMTDLVQSQTMPFGEKKEWVDRNGNQRTYAGGTLQNKSTYVDDENASKGEVSIVSDTPYARRLYYHPEYNFYKGENPYAGGLWFEPYISGSKKDFVKDTFAKFLERSMK